MPIFEYECRSCGDRFEELMGHSDPDPECPSCDGDEVRRLLSHTSFRLKGTGWYATDYARPAASKKNGAGAGKDSKGLQSAGEKGSSGGEAAADSGSSKASDAAAA